MDLVLIAPFGFAIAVATLLSAYFWRLVAISVGSGAPAYRPTPHSH